MGPTAVLSSPNAPAIEVALSRPLYRIVIEPKTGEPRMPTDVVAKALPVRWPKDQPAPKSYIWRAYVEWDYEAFPTRHRINSRVFVQPGPLMLDFGKEVRGGTLTVVARAGLKGAQVVGLAQAAIVAGNPPRDLVLRVFPSSRFGFIASKIGTAESGLRQFTTANGDDPGGMPVVSRTDDVGMMQLNVPTGALTSADEVWDWRANLRRGLLILRTKQQTSYLASRSAESLRRMEDDGDYQLACLNVVRQLAGLPCLPPSSLPPLSDRPGSGAQPGDPDVDRLQVSEWERDAIRRYNGGREYSFGIVPDYNTLEVRFAGWQIDPTRGGVAPNRGAPDYVRRVLAARSGMVWPPKPAARPTRHRKSRS